MIDRYILAQLCEIAYRHQNTTNSMWKHTLPERLAKLGGSEVVPIIRSNHEMYACTIYVEGSERRRVYVFRGTEASSILDVLTDLKAKRQRPAYLNSRLEVAESFALAADALEAAVAIDAKLYPDAKLVFAGHSLGGAIATILAERFTKITTQVHELFTLGCPRVGNEVFAAVLEERLGAGIQRYQNRNDPVCLVPFKRWDYCHVGKPYYFTSSNTKQFTGDLRLPEEHNDWHQAIDRSWQAWYTFPNVLSEARNRHSCWEYINLIKLATSH